MAANNYATSLVKLERFEEAKSLLRRTLPIVQRVHGENDDATLRMRPLYAHSLYCDPSAKLDDVSEAVAMLEESERIARRVLGRAHPLTTGIEISLRNARAALALALAK